MNPLKRMPNRIAAMAMICLLWAGCAATPQNPQQSDSAPDRTSSVSDARTRAAEELLMAMDTEHSLQKVIEKMLDIQLQQKPELVPYRKVMIAFFDKHMSYDSLKDELIEIYTDAFSEEELAEITRFYKTPTGRKTVEKMPELASKGARIGAARVQENLGELQEMIQKEAERIQQSQKQ